MYLLKRKSTLILIMSVLIYMISILFILTYPMTLNNNIFLSLITLIVSILFMVKVKKNIGLFIIGLLIAYVNYSIFIGEFLFFETLTTPFTSLKTIDNYGLAIKSVLIFIWTLFYFIKDIQPLHITYRYENLIFIVSVLFLVYILIFGIIRTPQESYQVAITPLYEYSKLVLIAGFVFSGNKKGLKIILSLLALLLSLQDIYYGGRITTIQIGLIVLFMMFHHQINYKNILLLFIVGLIGLEAVNIYRYNYDISQIDLSILSQIINKYLMFDTATFAFYSSITHIEVSSLLSLGERLSWFVEFMLSMVELNTKNIDISLYISNNYYLNYGGGLITSWFYFWLGYLGIIFISLLTAFLIRYALKNTSLFHTLIFFVIVVTVPRWYLYSPNHLIRGLLLMAIFYACVRLYFKWIKKKPLEYIVEEVK